MTNEEALLILKNMVCTEKWLGEARDLACQALEKQVSKEMELTNGVKCFRISGIIYTKCSRCKENVGASATLNYCPNCGQKLEEVEW